MSSRTSVLVAVILVLVGVARLVTDTLHEVDPEYWRAVQDSWLRYLIRAPSDGSWVGDLNAQWFKILSVPAGVSLIFLRNRFGPDVGAVAAEEFRDWAVRGVWIGVFLAGFTFLEFQKQFGDLALVAGEDARTNHVIHVLSAAIAWMLSARFTFGADETTGDEGRPASQEYESLSLGPEGGPLRLQRTMPPSPAGSRPHQHPELRSWSPVHPA